MTPTRGRSGNGIDTSRYQNSGTKSDQNRRKVNLHVSNGINTVLWPVSLDDNARFTGFLLFPVWMHTLFYLHWKHIHPVHSLLQLILGRGRHGVDVLIASVVLGVGIHAEHLKDSVKHTVQAAAPYPSCQHMSNVVLLNMGLLLCAWTDNECAIQQTHCRYSHDKPVIMLANLSEREIREVQSLEQTAPT